MSVCETVTVPVPSVTYKGPPGRAAKSGGGFGTLVNPPTMIARDHLKFLIMDAPHYDNVGCYIEELQRHNVAHFVRTCERTYDESVVQDAGIEPHALPFPDGEPPSDRIISKWLELVTDASEHNAAVGVHCLAGLGRAPVLVVIALIEHGMRNVEAIELVRSQRRGAINRKQLEYLMSYRPRRRRPMGTKWCCSLI